MDDRAVSPALNYTIILGITAILVVGLLTAGGNFVESQRNSVVDSELDVIGERLAADIATADRLVRAGDASPTVNLTAQLPDAVSGQPYTITLLTSNGTTSVELTSPSLDRRITAHVANTTAVAPASVTGGTVEIYYDPNPGRLVVRDAS
jgi:hypothetical protein